MMLIQWFFKTLNRFTPCQWMRIIGISLFPATPLSTFLYKSALSEHFSIEAVFLSTLHAVLQGFSAYLLALSVVSPT